MRNDLAIQGVLPVNTAADAPFKAKPDTALTPEPASGTAGLPIYVNPALRLDAKLGIVVIEFRDASGSITNSIPNEHQLRAYRQSEQSASGARNSEVQAFNSSPATGSEPGSVSSEEDGSDLSKPRD